jgi:hypothetical protein
LKKNCIKGPVMPSFVQAKAGTKKIMVWKPGTQSIRQRMKYLTRACASILDSKDPDTVRVGGLIFKACEAEPRPRYAALVIMNAAREASESSGADWPTCASVLIHQFIEARVERLKTVSPPAEREVHASTRTDR